MWILSKKAIFLEQAEGKNHFKRHQTEYFEEIGSMNLPLNPMFNQLLSMHELDSGLV